MTLLNVHGAGYSIIFCSGREDLYREQTERFIKKHLDFEYELFMRKAGDDRKDSLVKEEIYNNNIAPKYNISARTSPLI